MQQEVYLIDGSAYIYRAYHAIAPLSTSGGVPTHAVLGFVNMVRRLIRDKNPAYLAIAFDSRGPVFRHQLYSDYKATRPPMPDDLRSQLPYIKRFVAASNILTLEEEGVEADDIIASATRLFSGQGHRVVLVSGDKDLLQLVGERVVVWDPMKDRIFDRQAVYERYGVFPEHLLDLFALIGDSSDNVPGVPGVGPKTADKLISSYGSLEGLFANLENLGSAKLKDKLVQHRESAFLSRQLIDLKSDVALPESLDAYRVRGENVEELARLYGELEFNNLLKGLDRAQPVPTEGFTTVRTSEQLAAVLETLRAAPLLVVDTETTSLNARCAELVGISLCASLDRAWYLPLGHRTPQGELVPGQLAEEVVRQALLPLLRDPQRLKIGHNLKYDLTVFKQRWGLNDFGAQADTLIAGHLLEVGRSLKLDDLCLARGLRLTTFAEVTGGDKRDGCFAYVDIDRATVYSCEDVYGTLLLWQEFAPLLQERHLDRLFTEVEMPLVAILADMEIAGIAVDGRVLDGLAIDFREKLGDLEQRIHGLAGHPFNVNSPKQLAQVLFEELGLSTGKKTKTGFSTDGDVLEKLAGQHPLPELVLEYRSFAKLLSTYVEKLRLLQDGESGRVHTTFNQAVTATGRLSSSDPNLQNIPIRSEEGGRLRAAFVPAAGQVFLAADYSQIDLRVLAHYSKDPALIGAFRAGEDIHARTAAEIFGVAQPLVTGEMRRVAKSINFGIVYGMSSFGLSEQLRIGRKEAQRFIDRYFALYCGVKRFMEEIVVQARRDGYVTTLLGRRRSLADIDAKNKATREFAERTAINTPIQGTAADIMKLAMIACRKVIAAEGLRARMLLQIHDELVFELPPDEVEPTTAAVTRTMEQVLALEVPLVVNCVVGENLSK